MDGVGAGVHTEAKDNLRLGEGMRVRRFGLVLAAAAGLLLFGARAEAQKPISREAWKRRCPDDLIWLARSFDWLFSLALALQYSLANG